MYPIVNNLHSYWAWLTLILLVIAVANAVTGVTSKRNYQMGKDLRIHLFALIFVHIQLIIGFVLYFVSPNFGAWSEGGVMGNSLLRLLLVEHPTTNLIAIALITIGWSKHKKIADATGKFKKIALFYGLGLVLILLRIPYDLWLS